MIGQNINEGVEDTTSPAIYLNATVDSGEPYSLDYPNLLVNSTAIAGPMTAGMYVYTAAPLKEIRFFYNADGLRTRKQRVLGNRVIETTDYILHGKLVTEMRRGSDVLHFFYDAQSRPAMVKYNGQMYTYVHNLQGDIVAIVDSVGNRVVEYRYDAWGRDIGRTLTSDIGELNPFRYRGYVYDEETGLYYLRSRYYNAGMGRFVSADSIIEKTIAILACNLFSYCSNHPICHNDRNGKSSRNTLAAISGAVKLILKRITLRYNFYYKRTPKTDEINGHMDFTDRSTNITYSFGPEGWSQRNKNQQYSYIKKHDYILYYMEDTVSEEDYQFGKDFYKKEATTWTYDIDHFPCYLATNEVLSHSGFDLKKNFGMTEEQRICVLQPEDFLELFTADMVIIDIAGKKKSDSLTEIFPD